MHGINCQLEVLLSVSLMLSQIFAFNLLFATNGRIFTRDLFKQALLAMFWEVTSYYTTCTPTLWARYLYHGAFVKVLCCCHFSILPSLLAVRTLVLASWTPLLRVLLHVFTK
jgi:hypothetical protein